MKKAKHFAVSGCDDPAVLKTPCNWVPRDQRPLSMQPEFARDAYYAQITRSLFEVTCVKCRIAMKRGKHLN